MPVRRSDSTGESAILRAFPRLPLRLIPFIRPFGSLPSIVMRKFEFILKASAHFKENCFPNCNHSVNGPPPTPGAPRREL